MYMYACLEVCVFMYECVCILHICVYAYSVCTRMCMHNVNVCLCVCICAYMYLCRLCMHVRMHVSLIYEKQISQWISW